MHKACNINPPYLYDTISGGNRMAKETIIVTGGAGFIGSALIWGLNQQGFDDIIVVDSPGKNESWRNLVNLRFSDFIDKNAFIEKLERGSFGCAIGGILHMGACSDTTETDVSFFMKNNFEYTRRLALWAVNKRKRFIYASSAATYGNGHNFSDDEKLLPFLRPLNIYGYSKHLFDLWALKHGFLKKIAGLKYFNVFGPNEYHKGQMKSVVCKKFYEILSCGKATLFKSYRKDISDGEQKRDFIYIKDAVDITLYVYQHQDKNGIYNVGTGLARSFLDVVRTVFTILNKQPCIEFIDMPEGLRDAYQYFTQADISKLRKAGYKKELFALEEAVGDYLKNYLLTGDPYLKCLP